ncbi:MAG: hypothetical protein KIT84_05490 [Labilithrix sp.]|nr:hypothetical protein [Labilithrix sp.]MCW5810441.1 hypothetical protein [Labilithrix sp.]
MKLSRSARFRLGASLLIGGGLVACVIDPLNPQPLPPQEPSALADGGVFAPPPTMDSGAQTEDSFRDGAAGSPDGEPPNVADEDGGTDGGADAGDAEADAGDAGNEDEN